MLGSLLKKDKDLFINIFYIVEGPILEMESGRGFFINTLGEKKDLVGILENI
jgi:hypothetical protein